MLLYHVNAGFPVVDEGSELLVPATAVEPRGDHPVEGYRKLDGPTPAFVEQVFEHELVERGRRERSRRDRQPPARRRRVRGLRPHPAPAPLRVAHARRGNVRRRDRAVHEPHRGPPRRTGARRADRARAGEAAPTGSSWARSTARGRSTGSWRASNRGGVKRASGRGTTAVAQRMNRSM